MGNITRQNIIDSIDFKEEDSDNGVWSNSELQNAMVAAYNRALDDAQEVMEKYDSYYNEYINKLKI